MNLNGRVTNPGELRTKITLQQRDTSQTGGFLQPVWSDIATVWAKWVNLHGAEVWASQSIGAEQAATVTIRYRTGVDCTCAVLNGSERYEIVAVDDIQARHEYLELKVTRMRSG